MSSGLKDLQKRIKYSFKDEDLLIEALTHPSARCGYSYERLEFLGDAVLSVCISKMLFCIFPDDDEGDLSKKHVNLVCAKTIAIVAQKLDIGKYIVLSNAEEKNDGRNNPRTLENALEALLAAIFLDSDINKVSTFIYEHWYNIAKNTISAPENPKSQLQELAQSINIELPTYKTIEKLGSDHKPMFKIEVSLGNYSATSTAKSKKIAEQQAAGDLLKTVKKSLASQV